MAHTFNPSLIECQTEELEGYPIWNHPPQDNILETQLEILGCFDFSADLPWFDEAHAMACQQIMGGC